MAIRLTEETTSGSCFTSVLCVFCSQSCCIYLCIRTLTQANTKEMLFSINDFSVTAPASLEAKADTRKILSIVDKKQGMGIGRSNILD